MGASSAKITEIDRADPICQAERLRIGQRGSLEQLPQAHAGGHEALHFGVAVETGQIPWRRAGGPEMSLSAPISRSPASLSRSSGPARAGSRSAGAGGVA